MTKKSNIQPNSEKRRLKRRSDTLDEIQPDIKTIKQLVDKVYRKTGRLNTNRK